MHLVFVGAHPDDEIHASGTIAKHVAFGGKATIVLATRGEKGHWNMLSEELGELRTREMEEAAKILGANLMWLNYEDASIPAGDELKEKMVEVYRELKPSIVITFHPLVWRDDHRRVGLAASDATLKASLPLHKTNHPYHRPEPKVYFFGETMIPIEPDAYVDVTPQIQIKHQAFLCHQSQWASWEIDGPVTPNHTKMIWSRLRESYIENGSKFGVDYAEAFISRERREKTPLFISPVT